MFPFKEKELDVKRYIIFASYFLLVFLKSPVFFFIQL